MRLLRSCYRTYYPQNKKVKVHTAQRQQLIVESCRTIGSSLGFSGIQSFLLIAVAVTVTVVPVIVVTVVLFVTVVVVVVVVSDIILRKLSFTRKGSRVRGS